MPESPLRLVKRIAEFQPIDKVSNVPQQRRGFYVLYRRRGKKHYDVVYVGIPMLSTRADGPTFSLDDRQSHRMYETDTQAAAWTYGNEPEFCIPG